MFKILMILLGFMICFSNITLAQVKESQIANVVNIRSDFDYKDPKELAAYEAEKAEQEKNEDDNNKVKEPEDLFRVYLTRDRFYEKEDGYREDIIFSVTSHNMKRNYILDKNCPPYLEIMDNEENKIILNFSKIKHHNPYWISFILTEKEINQMKSIKEAKLILPEATENMFVENKKKGKIEKRKYSKKIKTEKLSYDIPTEIIQEWKQVLSADLARK